MGGGRWKIVLVLEFIYWVLPFPTFSANIFDPVNSRNISLDGDEKLLWWALSEQPAPPQQHWRSLYSSPPGNSEWSQWLLQRGNRHQWSVEESICRHGVVLQRVWWKQSLTAANIKVAHAQFNSIVVWQSLGKVLVWKSTIRSIVIKTREHGSRISLVEI